MTKEEFDKATIDICNLGMGYPHLVVGMTNADLTVNEVRYVVAIHILDTIRRTVNPSPAEILAHNSFAPFGDLGVMIDKLVRYWVANHPNLQS